MQKRVFLERGGRSIANTPWGRSGDAGRATLSLKVKKKFAETTQLGRGESNLKVARTHKENPEPKL